MRRKSSIDSVQLKERHVDKKIGEGWRMATDRFSSARPESRSIPSLS
jgi:hypothetical protein